DELGPKDNVRHPEPEPERERTPNAAESYIGLYTGNSQHVGLGVQGDDEVLEMGGLVVDEFESG
ncbi:hypothetical protein FRC09_020351, partial [Ceratobasidium sp. 395]